jgi:hypothetical protein
MTFVEEKVVDAILKMIRKRRIPSLPDDYLLSDLTISPASAKLREAAFTDFEAVDKLKRRWGFVQDSLENWERLWHQNPAMGGMKSGLPIGWVLEAQGRVVGYLGNISLPYRYGDRTLIAVAASGFVVEPAYRAVSLSLIAAYYRQKSVDLYLTSTAIEAVGKIARAFKSDPLPQEDYETVLFWVLQPYVFAQEVAKKLNLKPSLEHLGAMLGSLAVGTDRIVRRRWPRRSSTTLAVTEISVKEIGDDFQALWIEKLSEGPRLLADRSPAVLRWHFGIPGDQGTTCVLCAHKNGELSGYAVIRNDSSQSDGLRRSLVADMLVRQDDQQVSRALLVAAYDHAKQAGSHILEMLGFPHSIRRVCFQWNPYMRKYPSCPFYYKAADPTLHKALSDSSAWYASPYDGDATLMPLRGTSGLRDENNVSSGVPEGEQTGVSRLRSR